MKSLKIPPSAFSVLETDVSDDDEDYEVIARYTDWEKRRLRIPDSAREREELASALTDLSNLYDDMVEYKLGIDDPRFARNAARALATLSSKVRRVENPWLRKEKAKTMKRRKRTANVDEGDLAFESGGFEVYVRESSDFGWFYTIYRTRTQFVGSQPGFANREDAIAAAEKEIGSVLKAANPSENPYAYAGYPEDIQDVMEEAIIEAQFWRSRVSEYELQGNMPQARKAKKKLLEAEKQVECLEESLQTARTGKQLERSCESVINPRKLKAKLLR